MTGSVTRIRFYTQESRRGGNRRGEGEEGGTVERKRTYRRLKRKEESKRSGKPLESTRDEPSILDGKGLSEKEIISKPGGGVENHGEIQRKPAKQMQPLGC